MHNPYRRLKGLFVSQDETCGSIARQINMSPQVMSSRLQGKTPFTAVEIAKIGKILHLSESEYYRYFIEPIEK